MRWQRLQSSHLLKKQQQNNKKQNSPQQDSKTQQRNAPSWPLHSRQREDNRRAPPVSSIHCAFKQREPQHTSSLHRSSQRQVTCRQEKPGHGPFSNLCCQECRPIPGFSLPRNNGRFLTRLGLLGQRQVDTLPLVTTRTLALQPRPKHTVRFQGDRAACSFYNSWNVGRISKGHVTYVPSTQLSPQVNQDYNHNSKDRIVLFFPFFS